MEIHAVLLLLLEQGDHSLEDHTTDFLDVVCLIHCTAACYVFFITPGLMSGRKHTCLWMVLEGASPSM